MAKILTFEIPEDEYNEIQRMLELASDEMRRSHEAMQKDQVEIDRLTKEIEQIKQDTQKLEAESDRILADLTAKWLEAA